jgi:nucleoside-diphosphate-sugar epimerase
LQGELAALYLADSAFSVLALRKGTVCGYSPRMRLDLVINTMFKTALESGEIRVNNPDIWRPIVGIQDAAAAYLRAVEAEPSVSGVFNIVSRNYAVGEIGAGVKREVERLLDRKIELRVNHLPESRSYRVRGDKAARVLGFQPRDSVETIVAGLVAHRTEFADLGSAQYYNIQVFKALDAGVPAAAQALVQK